MTDIAHSISGLLLETERQLFEVGIPSPRLDAEVLLTHALSVTRPYLHAHSEKKLSDKEISKFERYVDRRLNREPVAYIIGKKEFYGREFIVTPDVLIPRPETESLVDLTLNSVGETNKARLVDVGCGSGCIGVTLKLERPELDVTLCDISPSALRVAKNNAQNLNASVGIAMSDLLSSFLSSKTDKRSSGAYFDIIIANLPYVNPAWETSLETTYEPKLALYAEDNGLKLVKSLIEQSPALLKNHGLIFIETDPEQQEEAINYAKRFNLTHTNTSGYAMSFTMQ